MVGPMRPVVIVRPTWTLMGRMEVTAKLGAREEQSQGRGVKGSGGDRF